jgi:hypothetical protein
MSRYNSIHKLLAPLLLLISSSASAFPETFDAHYRFIAKGMELGETHYRLERAKEGDEAQYRFSTHTEPTGLAALLVKKIIDEESYWKWQNGELRPLQYRYQQKGKRQRLRTRDFHWEQRRVTINEDGTQHAINGLQPGTVDEALFLISLMHDLKQGKKSLIYPVVKGKGWSQYEFQRGPRETITVPAGTFQTRQIVRKSSAQHSFRLWVAPVLNYLPVQIEYREEGGKLFMLQLKGSSIEKVTAQAVK